MSLTKHIEQRGDEWFEIRLGRFTASNAFKLVDRTAKGLPSAAYKDYIMKTVSERLTGKKTDIFTNAAMQWGVDNEPVAVAFFEELYDVKVSEHGFEINKELEYCGASPDGCIDGTKTLIEIKCPQFKNFIEVKSTDTPNPEYVLQVQWQLWCMDYEDAYLFYYHPHFPPEICFHRFHIKRNEQIIDQLRQAAISANEEVESIISKLYGRK